MPVMSKKYMLGTPLVPATVSTGLVLPLGPVMTKVVVALGEWELLDIFCIMPMRTTFRADAGLETAVFTTGVGIAAGQNSLNGLDDDECCIVHAAVEPDKPAGFPHKLATYLFGG